MGGLLPPPPNCGKRLLSHVIDEHAASNHKMPFASIPITTDPNDGYREISYKQLANSINRVAKWILDTIGPPTQDGETIVYLAKPDFRYQVFILAAVKAGYVTFVISPRNSREALESLLQESNAHKLVTDDKPNPTVKEMQTVRPGLQKFQIPSLEDVLDNTPTEHMPLNVTWEAYRFRSFVQIHSSGSTGIPKLITLRHGTFTAVDAYQFNPGNEMAHRVGNMRIAVSFPPFHVAGIIYALVVPVWFNSTAITMPVAPLTAQVMTDVHRVARADQSNLIPVVLADIAKDPECFQTLSKLTGGVNFAGGPLAETVGTVVKDITSLTAGYGSSELITIPQLPKSAEDWAYFHIDTESAGIEFRERDKGLYELCVVRKPELDLKQPVFVTFPDIDEFCTKDVFSPHPTKPGLWKYASRIDDIIVLSNGEKLNPVTMEGTITSSPSVKGCVVFGQGRFQTGLILEPTNTDDQDLIEKVWPQIEKANSATVKHGRISKDYIIVTSPSKPLPRAGKGTIQRASANKLYEDEINALYDDSRAASTLGNDEEATQLHFAGVGDTRKFLRQYVQQQLQVEDFHDDADFFSLGMDSLQVMNLARLLARSFQTKTTSINPKIIYDNPSVSQLAAVLYGESDTDAFEEREYLNDSEDEGLQEAWMDMDAMYKGMTSNPLEVDPEKGSGKRSPAKSARRSRRTHTKPMDWLRSFEDGPVIAPDGGFSAYLQVFSMFLVNLNNWGMVNSFGVFEAFYEQQPDIAASHSASDIAWIGTLQGALLLIVGTVAGSLFDRGYFKLLIITGSIGFVLALVFVSLSTQYYQLMLSQGVMMGACQGLLYIPSIAMIPLYFRRNRGLALGLSTVGGSIGGVIYPAVFYRLLPQIGFGWTTRVMALIAAITLGSAILISKPLGARSPRQLLDFSAFRETPYLTFLASAFFLLAGLFVPFFLAPSFSIAQLAEPSSLSFALLIILNGSQAVGRVLACWASDYRSKYLGGPEVIQLCGELCLAVIAFCWPAVTNLGGYVPWLIFYGFFSGLPITLPALILPYICPDMASYGTRLGMLYAFAGLGFLISSPVASATTHNGAFFVGAEVWSGATLVVAAAFFSVTAFEARKRRKLHDLGRRPRRFRGAR